MTLSDAVAFGDLDNDGYEDAAVVTITDPGGSGTFYDLAVVMEEGGQPVNVAIAPLGDRVQIQAVTRDMAPPIDDGRMLLDLNRDRLTRAMQQIMPSLERAREQARQMVDERFGQSFALRTDVAEELL